MKKKAERPKITTVAVALFFFSFFFRSTHTHARETKSRGKADEKEREREKEGLPKCFFFFQKAESATGTAPAVFFFFFFFPSPFLTFFLFLAAVAVVGGHTPWALPALVWALSFFPSRPVGKDVSGSLSATNKEKYRERERERERQSKKEKKMAHNSYYNAATAINANAYGGPSVWSGGPPATQPLNHAGYDTQAAWGAYGAAPNAAVGADPYADVSGATGLGWNQTGAWPMQTDDGEIGVHSDGEDDGAVSDVEGYSDGEGHSDDEDAPAATGWGGYVAQSAYPQAQVQQHYQQQQWW